MQCMHCTRVSAYLLYIDKFSLNLVDVNECETNPPPCGQICRNTVGSYVCSCVSGYTLAEDGLTCNREEGTLYIYYCDNVRTLVL